MTGVMDYEYSGYLSTILPEPDRSLFESVEGVTFDAADLAKWRNIDVDHALEWRRVPVRKIQTDGAIRIEGDFRNVNTIDMLAPGDPRYWVSLTTLGMTDSRFPIDVTQYPVIEVTYRCASTNAHPTWMWTYDGGSHFGALPKTDAWRTVARKVQHFDFPTRVDDVLLRLYSATRTVESLDIKSVRFRAMTDQELEATRTSLARLEDRKPGPRYDILREFLPLGVYMDADSADRLADTLGVTSDEYWQLVLEDLVMHGHNAVALAHFDRMDAGARDALLARCERDGIRIVARHEFPVGGDEAEQQRVIDRHIKPTAHAPAMFARTFSGEPIENDFLQVLDAKQRIEEADPDHPVALVARYPNSYPLFAPYFSVTGIGHFASRRPWDAGKTVRTHVPLSDSQQFWLAAPAFMYPTQTPQWSTCPEMRLMANLAFANGARGWFAYSYHNEPVWQNGRLQRSLTGPFLTFSDIWSELMLGLKWIDALAPLLLETQIEDTIEDWFLRGVRTQSTVCPEPGIAPVSQYHLRGGDFSLYITVSNNTREIAGIEIDIPPDLPEGVQAYDLSAFVKSQVWGGAVRQGHLEMFPGQAHVLLVATEECAHAWRDRITQRLVQSALRKIRYPHQMARNYGLDTGEIEASLEALNGTGSLACLSIVKAAADQLTDMLYANEAITRARSSIIEASAACCGCDGALCRLMALGKGDYAQAAGPEVVALAREFTRQRVELRRGNAAAVIESAEATAVRGEEILKRLRRHY